MFSHIMYAHLQLVKFNYLVYYNSIMKTIYKFYLFLPLLINLALAVGFSTSITTNFSPKDKEDDRVQINLYYESLSPYSKQFLLNSLKNAAKTPDFWKICNFKLFPYGNTQRVKDREIWIFTCQNGVVECILNTMQTCALKMYNYQTQALPFILCLEADTTNFIAQGKKCAAEYKILWDALSYCTNSDEGINYQEEMAIATESLQPAHTYIPWIVVNGVHAQSSQSAVISNMVRYVCSIYKGEVKIDACN